MNPKNIENNTNIETLKLSNSQIEMIKMSEDDYLHGRVISNDELEKEELKLYQIQNKVKT